MKGRDVVNWLVQWKDYTIPVGTFLLGWLIGKVL